MPLPFQFRDSMNASPVSIFEPKYTSTPIHGSSIVTTRCLEKSKSDNLTVSFLLLTACDVLYLVIHLLQFLHQCDSGRFNDSEIRRSLVAFLFYLVISGSAIVGFLKSDPRLIVPLVFAKVLVVASAVIVAALAIDVAWADATENPFTLTLLIITSTAPLVSYNAISAIAYGILLGYLRRPNHKKPSLKPSKNDPPSLTRMSTLRYSPSSTEMVSLSF